MLKQAGSPHYNSRAHLSMHSSIHASLKGGDDEQQDLSAGCYAYI
jgi:hypothetical protein